ncbi:M15 family metallopeptidase [Cellulosimicrobium cellulans]|uniref:M15 family metallopeptidase n=1 Tax=Cellulosimicrobium cellulans TaxID=1710 RepID=UPI00130DADA4|nr:M15 family metallopeptidase [Cellulosimicrobium cellulans]
MPSTAASPLTSTDDRRRRRAWAPALTLALTTVVALSACSAPDERQTSQNGWEAITSGYDQRMEPFPYVTGRVLSGDVYTVLAYVADRFDAEVEPIDVASSWGWAHRPVRGGEDLSNHASGTAIDLNAPAHPLGVPDTFTAEQVSVIRSILAEVDPVVSWGGDYAERKDDMHFEVVGTPQDVSEVAARLGSNGTSEHRGPQSVQALVP